MTIRAYAAGALFVALGGCSAQRARPPETPGLELRDSLGRFVFVDHRGDAGRPVNVCYYRPGTWTDTSWVVFFLTGSNREPRDVCRGRSEAPNIAAARRYGYMLVAPEFDPRHYPGRAGYNFGNMVDSRGRARPRDRWTLLLLEHLFDAVRDASGARRNEYLAFGFSAGAQYVQRLVLFVPEARVRRAIAADAGAYALPDPRTRLPYGLSGSGLSADELRNAFARDFIVFVGEADTSTAEHADWPEAQQQGPHRLARARWFVKESRALASSAGATFAWRLSIVDGVGHEGGRMVRVIVDSLFRGIQPRLGGAR